MIAQETTPKPVERLFSLEASDTELTYILALVRAQPRAADGSLEAEANAAVNTALAPLQLDLKRITLPASTSDVVADVSPAVIG